MSNLPVKGNINAVREDYVNPNLLFVGTEFSLFVTLDGGASWKPFSTGLPKVRVDDILIHPRDRDLIIATHGRSIWIADDITPLEQLASTPGQSVKLFDPRPAVQWRSDLEATRRATARDFHGENPQGGTAISFWAASDLGDAKIEFLDAGGQVVSTTTTTAHAGMNRVQWNMAVRLAAADLAVFVGGGGGRGGAPSNLTPAEIAAGEAAYAKAGGIRRDHWRRRWSERPDAGRRRSWRGRSRRALRRRRRAWRWRRRRGSSNPAATWSA